VVGRCRQLLGLAAAVQHRDAVACGQCINVASCATTCSRPPGTQGCAACMSCRQGCAAGWQLQLLLLHEQQIMQKRSAEATCHALPVWAIYRLGPAANCGVAVVSTVSQHTAFTVQSTC